jgi:hypothetical protein
MMNRLAVMLLTAAILLGPARLAGAVLQAVDLGPYLAGYGFYPAWYQDTNGLKLELCLSQTVSPNVPPTNPPSTFMCTLLPEPGFDPNLPIVFPANWGGETFWFTGDAAIDLPNNSCEDGNCAMELITAVEAAFGTDAVVNGDQISFARVRIRIDVPSPGGVYTVTTPYGTFRCGATCVALGSPDPLPAAPGRRGINFTEDVGIGAPGNFTGALTGRIGPFLQAANAPGGAPTPTIIPATGEVFVGDPNIEQFVTGSPLGANFFRVEGPGLGTNASFSCNSTPAPTNPSNCVETKLFVVSGKMFDERLPTAVTVDRSTYARTPLGTSQIDVFATSTAAATLSMRDALVGGVATAMTSDNEKFYGKQLNAALVPPPPFVVVRAEDQGGGTRPAELSSRVVDVVKITRAAYALDTRTLLIEATSSDKFAPLPTLTVIGLGCPGPADPCVLESAPGGVTNTLNVPNVAQPPARITVISSQGGSDTEPVQIVPSINIAPVANPDSASATQGVAVVINLVANDTDLGGAIDPGSIALVPGSGPAGGTAQLNVPAPGQVTYTSTAQFFGTDSFRYTVKDNVGLTSNEATVTIRVNGRPIAVADSATSQGLAVNINVLGNDSDPDNNLPLTVANLTQPATGTGTAAVQSNNSVTYTPAVGFTGNATFTYQARDNLGALSAVAATVTVTVTATTNQPPVANPDTATTRVGTAVNIAVLANDTDPEGNLPLAVASLTPPPNGTVVLVANNTVTYTPNPGFAGTDTFTYRARDTLGGLSQAATVTVTVNPETLLATAQARVRNGRADWTVNGTTDVVTGSQGGNVITVRLARTNQVVGQAVPDNRGRWRLSVRNAVIPVAGDQVAVTSRYTTTPQLVNVTVR